MHILHPRHNAVMKVSGVSSLLQRLQLTNNKTCRSRPHFPRCSTVISQCRTFGRCLRYFTGRPSASPKRRWSLSLPCLLRRTLQLGRPTVFLFCTPLNSPCYSTLDTLIREIEGWKLNCSACLATPCLPRCEPTTNVTIKEYSLLPYNIIDYHICLMESIECIFHKSNFLLLSNVPEIVHTRISLHFEPQSSQQWNVSNQHSPISMRLPVRSSSQKNI